jgi:hypothetical protein
MLSAALWALNRDDDEYQELSATQKRDYWFIKLPGNDWFLTIPKPFEWALVPNIVEAALEEHRGVGDVMGIADPSDLVMQLTPTGLLPFLEAITNWNTYQKRAIVNPWDTGKPADLQVRDSTSDTARVAAYPFGVSPAKLEHVTFGLGGGLARDVAGVVDPVVRGLTTRGRPEPSQPPITRRVPGLAAIARPTAVDSSAQSLQDFYDAFERFEAGGQALAAYGKGEGLRNLEDARQEYLEEFPAERQATFKAAKKALDDLRDDLADVRGSRTMTPPQKAEEQKAIYEAMVDVARRALGRGGLTRTRFTRRETLAPQARAGVGR